MRSATQRAAQAALAGALGVLGGAHAQEQQAPPDAAPLPMWELRLGGSALYAPKYPAAEDTHVAGVGAPIFIYRGKRLRIGADEPNAVARAIAIEQKRFELDLSVDASFAAKSEEGDIREGMPDLDTQLEIGPQLSINFVDTGWTDEGRRRLRLLLPVRAVGATDFKSFEELGALVQPTLTYRRQWPGEKMSYSSSFAVAWADEGVQDYYYEIAPEYARPLRPAYNAEGGYLGSHLQISGRREVRPGLNVYLTYRLRSLAGAANDDSPLHREELTHAASISAVWTAVKSKRSARDRE